MINVGIIQLTSNDIGSDNLKKLRKFLEENDRSSSRSEYLFLPECFYAISNGKDPVKDILTFENEHFTNLTAIAKEFGVNLLGGSVYFQDGEYVKNRALFISKEGELLGHYDKRHLFRCELKDKVINEGDIFSPGESESIVKVDDFNIGSSICVDLRYPEVYQSYAKQGCQILTVASAFTVPTGKAHWHTLVRARAIENQCFVIAAAQWGQNHSTISTYGHSLIIDPWGEVLLDMKEGEGIGYAKVDLSLIDLVRKKIILDR